MIHQFVEVRRIDGRKIYKEYTGIVTKCELWEREKIEGGIALVPMCAVKDVGAESVTWHCKEELEEVLR